MEAWLEIGINFVMTCRHILQECKAIAKVDNEGRVGLNKKRTNKQNREAQDEGGQQKESTKPLSKNICCHKTEMGSEGSEWEIRSQEAEDTPLPMQLLAKQ